MNQIDADVIIPVTTYCRETALWASMAIRTCAASTKARILVMDNNTDPTYGALLLTECGHLGVSYHGYTRPFSTPKFFNEGFRLTRGKYIAYGSSDVIYFPGWLENIISLWEEQPDWFCLAPHGFGSPGLSCASWSLSNERRIVQTHNVSAGVSVFKRSDGYRWDEQFVWQCDSDFVYHVEANNLKVGYCLNARCDHLIGAVRRHVPENLIEKSPDDENKLLKQKWGSRYLGV